MAARDGDGWIECACGFKHWGKFGAAGLLIIRDGAILLQHRAPWVHNGDTWGIPGGARDSHETIIEGAMNDLVAKRGIYDYVVVCDTSNNTPDRIARNELYVDIAIEPMKDVEFIYIPIRLFNPGDIATLGSK